MYKYKDILKFFKKVYIGAYWLVFVGLGLREKLEKMFDFRERFGFEYKKRQNHDR